MKKRCIIPSMLLLLGACCCGTKASTDTPQEEKLSIPSGVALKEANPDSLTFVWNKVSGAQSYTYKLLKEYTLIKDGSCEEETVLISGLESQTAYRFAVRANSGSISSDYSEYLEASTTAQKKDPEPEPEPEKDVYAAMKIPSCEEDGVARAFPGAEGGGMYTTGGRGGSVYHVKNLDDSGEGSLRYGIKNAKRPCTIVFDVAGTITLKSALSIDKGDLTIAGQTAPGDGICLKGRYTQLTSDNIIIRYVRFRLGDEDSNASDSDDCLWGRYLSNIILDHCSMSWSIDECCSFYANSNFTMQWCYMAESMKSSAHSKGDHGYGGIWGGDNASYHHNLLAHHDSRNPRFDHPHIYENHKSPARRGVVDYRNNVVYDWGSNSSYGGEGYGAGKGTGINMVANYYKPGPSSVDKKYFLDAYGVYTSTCSNCGGKNIEEGYPLVYMSGNVHTKYSNISSDNPSGIYWHNGEVHTNYGKTSSSRFALSGPSGEKIYTTTHSASDSFDKVCALGGASLRRDNVDKRVSSSTVNGTGKIIDCVTSTSGKTSVESLYGEKWPNLSATEEEISRAATDSDADGIPDYYEKLLGLDPNDATDGPAKTIDKHKRYTNLEMYLHYLVRDNTTAQIEGGAYEEIK